MVCARCLRRPGDASGRGQVVCDSARTLPFRLFVRPPQRTAACLLAVELLQIPFQFFFFWSCCCQSRYADGIFVLRQPRRAPPPPRGRARLAPTLITIGRSHDDWCSRVGRSGSLSASHGLICAQTAARAASHPVRPGSSRVRPAPARRPRLIPCLQGCRASAASCRPCVTMKSRSSASRSWTDSREANCECFWRQD